MQNKLNFLLTSGAFLNGNDENWMSFEFCFDKKQILVAGVFPLAMKAATFLEGEIRSELQDNNSTPHLLYTLLGENKFGGLGVSQCLQVQLLWERCLYFWHR